MEGNTRPFFWFASYPKSGNTYARLFLAAYLNGGGVNINVLPRSLSWSDTLPILYQAVASRPLSNYSPHEILCLRGAALMNLASYGAPWPVITKTHMAHVCVDGWPMIPSKLTHAAVYFIRDPRDVCLSMAHHLGLEPEKVAENMVDPIYGLKKSETEEFKSIEEVLTSWSNHVKQWYHAKFPVHVFKYEDMVERPQETFEDLLDKMGFHVDKKLVRRSVEATKFAKLKKQEQGKGFTEQSSKNDNFFRKGTPGAWKTDLDPKVADKIAADHAEIMEQFGYE